MSDSNAREVVGLFHDVEALEQAAAGLMSNGFDQARLSLIAAEAAVDEKFGSRMMRVKQLVDDPDTPRIAYVDRATVGIGQGAIIGGLFYLGAIVGTGAVLASGGALLPAYAAAAVGGLGGGSLGAFLSAILHTQIAEKTADEVERGGLILWVRTSGPKDDQLAERIMKESGAYDVHRHGSGLGTTGVEITESSIGNRED